MPSQRPLSLENLRTFDAVARHLSFSAAGDELHLTQSAISRRVSALERELGAPLFARDTRRVELTDVGETLRQAVQPALERLDRTVRRIRSVSHRRHVSVATFASFATLWLLPRLASFQQAHPDIDIRMSATDQNIDLDDPEMDLVLRYAQPSKVPPHAERLFGEVVSPVASPLLASLVEAQRARGLTQMSDLQHHALLDQDAGPPGQAWLRWEHWLSEKQLDQLEPKRWNTLNYSHQLIQAAAAGQGVALGRLPLIHDVLERRELVEPFGAAGRLATPMAYWLIPLPGARLRPELTAFFQWLRTEALRTREAMGEL
jgi:LysR family transcriptional regulator, glycine cleavage system transcriptional activator